MKILFLGNSITLHGSAPEIGWFGNYGMAASRIENDYVHRLAAMLGGRGKQPILMVRNIADFERNPDGYDLNLFAEARDFDADIIVIRIVENVPAEKIDAFGKAYPSLIEYFNRDRHAKVFCVGSFWKNDAGDEYIKTAAASTGSVFVSLSRLHDVKYQAQGLFEHGGVAAHPSDVGMQAIADDIFGAIEAAGLLEAAKVYPVPEGEAVSDLYRVSVDGQDAQCYCCRVSAMPFNAGWPGHQRALDQTEAAAFVYFDMSAPVDVTVTADRDFTEAILRPRSDGVSLTAEGRKITFTIRKPGQFSLELDGRHNNLHIFANPAALYTVDENTVYFGAGVHISEEIVLRGGQTLFFDAGAVLYASVRCADAQNVRIIGHGIIDCSRVERHEPIWSINYNGLINLLRCENVLFDGVILRDSNWWSITAINSRNLIINNVKTIGMWRYNSDGFDFVNSQNVRVTDCFLRNFDDVIVLKGIREIKRDHGADIPGVYEDYEFMDMQNYLIENCVIWCDWGGALEIGAETVADEYTNIVFRDCDIIRNSNGGMRIQSGDRAVIHNVLYENIRVEYSKYDRASILQLNDAMKYEPEDTPSLPAVICGWMYNNTFTHDLIYGNVYDITYRNIYVTADEGMQIPEVSFSGIDGAHRFDRITIDGLYFNGNRIADASGANLHAAGEDGSITIL